MGRIFCRIAFRCVKYIILKLRIRGAQNISSPGPVIFVSNHSGSFGPVSVLSSIPVRVYPWVTHEITDIRKCGDYLRKDFLEAELGWRSSFSRYVLTLVSRICVSLMKAIEAIPVYKRSRRIAGTIRSTLRFLEEGKSILIFPENSNRRVDGSLCRFDTGYISLAKRFHQRTRRVIPFLPVAVNEKVNSIRIGKPVYFDPGAPFVEEKRRLAAVLEDTIFSMYYALQDGLVRSGCRGRL